MEVNESKQKMKIRRVIKIKYDIIYGGVKQNVYGLANGYHDERAMITLVDDVGLLRTVPEEDLLKCDSYKDYLKNKKRCMEEY